METLPEQTDTVTALSAGGFLIETNEGHTGVLCPNACEAFKLALVLFAKGTLALAQLQKIN